MQGTLAGTTVGGANVVNDMTLNGTTTYDTVGQCTWAAEAVGWGLFNLGFTEGTICDVPVADLAPFLKPSDPRPTLP